MAPLWKFSELLKWELVQLWIPAEEALSETVYRSCSLALWRKLLIQTDYINHDKNPLTQEVSNATLCRYLFEGLQHLGSLAEVFEDELQ